MNWDKAKNLTIVFLLMLNIILGILVYFNSNDYIVTSEEEAAIINVLFQNKISIYDQIPKKYEPLEQLILSPNNFTTDTFVNILFGSNENVKRTLENNKTIFSDDTGKTLTFINNILFFENENGSEKIELSKETAEAVCIGFIKENARIFPNFEIDTNETGFIENNIYKITYRQVYRDNIIYSNYVTFLVTENGIINIEYVYNPPVGFDSKPKDICSPDKVLFILMQHILNTYENEAIIIKKLDIVYYQEEINDKNDITIKTIPCYRFYISESNIPILINATTGNVI